MSSQLAALPRPLLNTSTAPIWPRSCGPTPHRQLSSPIHRRALDAIKCDLLGREEDAATLGSSPCLC